MTNKPAARSRVFLPRSDPRSDTAATERTPDRAAAAAQPGPPPKLDGGGRPASENRLHENRLHENRLHQIGIRRSKLLLFFPYWYHENNVDTLFSRNICSTTININAGEAGNIKHAAERRTTAGGGSPPNAPAAGGSAPQRAERSAASGSGSAPRCGDLLD